MFIEFLFRAKYVNGISIANMMHNSFPILLPGIENKSNLTSFVAEKINFAEILVFTLNSFIDNP